MRTLSQREPLRACPPELLLRSICREAESTSDRSLTSKSWVWKQAGGGQDMIRGLLMCRGGGSKVSVWSLPRLCRVKQIPPVKVQRRRRCERSFSFTAAGYYPPAHAAIVINPTNNTVFCLKPLHRLYFYLLLCAATSLWETDVLQPFGRKTTHQDWWQVGALIIAFRHPRESSFCWWFLFSLKLTL